MGRAKDILVKVIQSKDANAFVKKHHYSGRVVNNSNLHFGCFLDGKLGGVMSYGSPLDKRKVLGLVEGTLWNEMLELNRMAFSDLLPRNSESRCLAISFKMIKKNAPHIKWILSFSDGTQCGDGTIYRASGFVLTGVNKNKSAYVTADGLTVCSATFSKGTYVKLTNGRSSSKTTLELMGARLCEGFQLRYIKLLHPNLKLTCETLPFSKIDEMGAGMYKGEKVTLKQRHEQAQVARR